MFGLEIQSFQKKEMILKELLDDAALHTRNYSECQSALRTDHFVNLTFRGSNWSPTEQLVNAW